MNKQLQMPKSQTRLLTVLSSAAATLPAYAPIALADAPPDTATVALRYSNYQEDDLSSSDVLFGSKSRYDIDVTQLHVETPVGSNWSVALDVQNDYQTGASPWFVGQSASGKPGVYMSGASIQDNRVEVGVNTRYYWADGNAGFTAVHSDEDDYTGRSMTFDVNFNSEDASRTYSVSVSRSNDTVSPVKERIPVFIDSEDIDTHSAYFGVSQILTRTTIVKIGLSYTYSDGYLTDPYKFNDARPDERNRYTLSAGYRRFFPEADGALQTDYRYYSDDWGIDSHTLEIAWFQHLGQHSLKPYVRYYSQSEADFFSVVADRTQDYYADDYRLSTFGAFTAGLSYTYSMGQWQFELQAERYMSDGDWALSSGDSAPALVDFWRSTVGLSYQFD